MKSRDQEETVPLIDEYIERDYNSDLTSAIGSLNDNVFLLPSENSKLCKKITILKLALSSIIGVGTGLAMMPIFNGEIQKLEEIGIEIEDNNFVSAAVTINTLFIFTSIASITIYNLLGEADTHEKTKLQKIALDLGKVASVCSTVLPLSQLWGVEVQDRAFVGDTGFDKYIAWAAATSVPLCIYKSVDAYEYIQDFALGKLKNIDLSTVGEKLFVYTPTFLAAAGRFIAYTSSAAYLGMQLGISEEVSVALGTLIGGVMGSTVIGLAEYVSLKSLFEKSDIALTYKQITGGVFCALEGILLTLPLVTTGLTATENWNPIIKGLLFSPLFLTHSILEGRIIYKAFDSVFHGNVEEEPIRLTAVERQVPIDDIEILGLGDE